MADSRVSSSELQTALRRVPLFHDLDERALQIFARVAHIRNIAKHAYLFYQDDEGDAAYIVRSGELAIVLSTADGRELVINIMRAGDCVGELALLTNTPRSASALAQLDTQVIVLPRAEFLNELEREPKLLRHILELTAQRLRASAERERALAFLDAPARLARVVLEMEREASDRGYIMLSQDALAQHIGVARQTTAKILGQWRRAGWILTGRGKLVVLDKTALRRVAQA